MQDLVSFMEFKPNPIGNGKSHTQKRQFPFDLIYGPRENKYHWMDVATSASDIILPYKK